MKTLLWLVTKHMYIFFFLTELNIFKNLLCVPTLCMYLLFCTKRRLQSVLLEEILVQLETRGQKVTLSLVLWAGVIRSQQFVSVVVYFTDKWDTILALISFSHTDSSIQSISKVKESHEGKLVTLPSERSRQQVTDCCNPSLYGAPFWEDWEQICPSHFWTHPPERKHHMLAMYWEPLIRSMVDTFLSHGSSKYFILYVYFVLIFRGVLNNVRQ